VLLRAYQEFVKGSAEREVGSWLIQLATERLKSEVKRLKSKRNRTVHLEGDIPEVPPRKKSPRSVKRFSISISRTKI